MPRIRFGAGLGAVLAVAIAVPLAAWAADASKAVNYRQGVMDALAWHIGPIAGMAKGEIPLDNAALQHHADALAALSNIIVEGFPEGSTADNSKAKAEIWTDWDDFQHDAQELHEAAVALAAAAPTATKDTLGAALGPVGKACGDCHGEFRAK